MKKEQMKGMERKRTYRPIAMLGGENVLVDSDIALDLELLLVAAFKSYQAGIKGIDRLLKVHGESWRRQLEEERKKPSTLYRVSPGIK